MEDFSGAIPGGEDGSVEATPEPLTPDIDAAVAFLEWLRPGGPWVLTAIPREGGRATTDTFSSGELEQLRKWICDRNGKLNLYFMVNPARTALRSKAKKEDVEAVEFLHVDVDPRKGHELGPERARALKALEKCTPSPSAIIDSGGGYQGFWRLDEPLFVGGDLGRAAEAERYNIQLERELGGDSCHNVDRIMRLPGTINLPNDKKRKAGRKEALARVFRLGSEKYPLGEFTPAKAEERAASATAPVQLSKAPPPLKNLDELPKEVTPRMRMLIVQGDDPDDPTKYGSRSEVVFAVCCGMVRAGCDDETIAAVILDPELAISGHVLAQPCPVEYAARQIQRAREAAPKWEVTSDGRRVLNPAAPFRIASRLREELFPTLIHSNQEWLVYRNGAYIPLEDRTVRSELYKVLEEAVVVTKGRDGPEYVPFHPDKTKVAKVVEALEAVSHVEADAKAPPCWLDGEGAAPFEIVSCGNGLLHIPTGALLPPTPSFFTRNALELAYDRSAPEPELWLSFLRQIWPDGAAVSVLQEIFGYLLLPDTRFQKIFLLVGPTRSGKGTILRVLTRLVGRSNVCAPDIAELGKDFGLQLLIGKQLALVTDMRLGKKADLAAIAGNLLRISGEDEISANRKNKDYWTGRLATRFVISGNEMPRFEESSPALAKRFVPLVMEESFYGREDTRLADKLLAELPGILNWSIEGWKRLYARGEFLLPATSQAAVQEIQELGSPVVAFVHECCNRGPGKSVAKDALFAAWSDWCRRSGVEPGVKNHFARNLNTAFGGDVAAKKIGSAGSVRVPSFVGVELKSSIAQQLEADPY